MTFAISIYFASKFGDATPELSFFLVDAISENKRSEFDGMIVLGSLALGIFSVVSIAKTFKQIIESRLIGIVVACLGFFGTISILVILESFY